ncbi:MAG: hypothetical protein OEY94_03645 [Alphaproteobacteria bacterium]|nr:hypothetical protein [Alphaproteobacteria bacterium]
MRTVLLFIIIMLVCSVGIYVALDRGIIDLSKLRGDVESTEKTVRKDKTKQVKASKPKVQVKSKEQIQREKKAEEKRLQRERIKAQKKQGYIAEPSWEPEPIKPSKDEIDIFDLNGPYGDSQSCMALLEEESYKKNENQKFMVPGKDHWIFRTQQDFYPVYKYRENKAELYRIFAESLRLKGTELVIAYLPPRSVLASDKIISGNKHIEDFDVDELKSQFYGLLEAFQNKGVNLTSISYSEDGYKYFNWADHHWSTEGARAMAQSVSAIIKETDQWKDLPKEKFTTVRKGGKVYDGLYGKVIRDICGFVPYPERDYVYETTKEVGDLFGESNPPIVLIGTSNSKRGEFNSNFDGFLKEDLSLDVYNVALTGGGMDDSVIGYLESDTYKKQKPAFLVWELPSYYNLGGSGMEMALRRAIPAALGPCEEPILTFGPEPITGKRIRVVSEIEKQKIRTDHVYLELKFDRPLKKDISISIKTTDRKTKLVKFESPHEGKEDHLFFLLTGEDDESFLYSVAVNNSKQNFEGVNVTAKLCSLPEDVLSRE